MKTKTLFLVTFIFNIGFSFSQIIMNIHTNDGSILRFPTTIVDSISYVNHSTYNSLIIKTLPAENISQYSATLHAIILNDGGLSVSSRGFCWNTSPNPTTTNNVSYNNSGTGSYSRKIMSLSPSTTYYVRAFAFNSTGVVYGNEISFSTSSNQNIYTAGDGVYFDDYQYASIVYSYGKEWMAENLKTTKYSNGDLISNVTSNGAWESTNSGAWANYNNAVLYDAIYGKLYNWYAVADNRKICPNGWHVPSNQEWSELITFLGGESIAGGKMKDSTALYWNQPNTNATNESGFNALPSGARGSSVASFLDINDAAIWWSSTPYNQNAWGRQLLYNNGSVLSFYVSQKAGFAVRCVKD